jgi:hypothetical protein
VASRAIHSPNQERNRNSTRKGRETVPRLPKEIVDKLEAPFPQYAFKKYLIGTLQLTSMKAGAIVDRLHSAFGLGNVSIIDKTPIEDRLKRLEDGRYVVHYLGELVLMFENEKGQPDAIGIQLSGMDLLPSLDETCKKKSWGVYTEGRVVEDVWKGCRTNAISKAAFEHLGIGKKMYLGLMPFETINGEEVVVEYEGNSSFPQKRSGSPGEPAADPVRPEATDPGLGDSKKLQKQEPERTVPANARGYALEYAKNNKDSYPAVATELGLTKDDGKGGKKLIRILDMDNEQFDKLHAALKEKSPLYLKNLPKGIK